MLILGLDHFALAQFNDAQLWENINIEKNITPRLITRLVQQGRLTDNISHLTFYYLDYGFTYKFSKHIHGTIAYVWAEKQQLNETWSTRFQAYGAVTLRKKLKDFTLLDRQMFLWQVKDYNTSYNGRIPDYYLRNKLTIRYDKYFKIAPYMAAEIYYNENKRDNINYRFNRLRCFAGLFFRTNEENEFEAYYLFEKHFNEIDPHTNYVIGLGYTHSF